MTNPIDESLMIFWGAHSHPKIYPSHDFEPLPVEFVELPPPVVFLAEPVPFAITVELAPAEAFTALVLFVFSVLLFELAVEFEDYEVLVGDVVLATGLVALSAGGDTVVSEGAVGEGEGDAGASVGVASGAAAGVVAAGGVSTG